MTDPSSVPIPINTPAALAFGHEGEWLFLGLQLAAMAVPLAFLVTGWGVGLRGWLDRRTGVRRWLTLTLFAWILLVAETAVSLPLLYARDIVRWGPFAAQGFPPPTLAAWLAGQAVQLLVTAGLAAALLWIPFRLIERRPKTWPLIFTCLALPTLSVLLVLWQTVLMPMTTHFEPIRDRGLAAQIHALAIDAGPARFRSWSAATT